MQRLTKVGRITRYEVWNEPDGKWCRKHGVNAFELGAFTAATAKAVKAVDPTAEVIALAHCIPDLRYTHNALSVEGMAENIDAISFHEYVTDETHIPERVDSMRAVADMFKKGIRLIQGESGSQSKSGGNGDVYTVPDTILTDYGDGCLRFDHLPVTDRPMALLFGDFCDWSENV